MMFRNKLIKITVLVAVICSILSSAATVLVLKNTLFSTDSTSKSQDIVVNDTGKSENVYQAVAEKATPSVVGITTTSVDRSGGFFPSEMKGVGTGIIVDSKGYILTNSHVVSDGKATSVNVLFNDGSDTSGKVVWYDSQLDLAIVKVEKKGLSPAEFADSDKVKVGDISIAIGNPLGLEFQKSVTQGIISGLNRSIETEQAKMTGLLQTDASINSGNSGGPLLNSKGQVIGINTAKASQGEGMGFAIPINTAKSIVKEVIENGKYEKVTLGIKGMDLTNYEEATGMDLEAKEGVYVAEVIADSTADKAGLRAADVIVKVGGTKVTGMNDLNKTLYAYSKGKKSEIVVNRGGKEVKLNAQF
ncbi:serine protease HtrA [Metaclostridioides mangenotii]|uniref:serine protease HtrA n=1 Tax=Metaclostridioides mangenotii TaxID=1540 RepID=UPI0026F1A01A|nr:trypsin-like peptidase domain-containing protein [Clostridioides mangenotii]